MEFTEGFFKAILEKYVDPIVKGVADISKDAWEKFKVDFDIVYRKYVKNSYDKYSRIKTILYRTEPKYIYDFFEPPTLKKNQELIQTTDVNEILDLSHFIIIEGTGGIGKSTLLKHLFINELGKKDLIPIFLELKDINDLSNDYEIIDILLEKLNNLGSSLQPKFMEYALKSGCFLFLLDGYDEILTSQKNVFLKKFDAFCDRYSLNYFVVSSRPYSEFIEFQRFTVLSINALNKVQAISLIGKLEFDTEIKQRFIERLDVELYNKHQSFASNPLLLNIMLMTFDNFAEIPEKLHLFYANAFETLYSKHDATKAGYRREMHCKLSYDTFKKVFSYFCFISYNQGKLAFSYDDLAALLKNSSELSKVPLDIKDYIYDLTNSLCVLYRDGIEYRFSHRSFQEYFTSMFLKELPDDLMEQISIKMLQKDCTRVSRDSVFSMLYDMCEDRFEQNILLPILKEYEQDCTEADKYDFYFGRAVDAIIYRIDSDGEPSLWQSRGVSNDMISFIDRSTLHYLNKTKSSNISRKSQEAASKELFGYLLDNYDFEVEREIESSILIANPNVYGLLKDTWLGEKIQAMSELSEKLSHNQENMRMDLSSLMEL